MTPAHAPAPALERPLRLAAAAAFSSMASMRACDAMLLTLSAEFGRSLGDAARVVSIFAVAYGLLQLFYGPLGDRIGKMRVVALACTGCSLAAAAAAWAPSLDWLVGARALMGAAAAGIVPMTIAWIGDQVPYEQRQETLARLLGATVGGMIAGMWLGAWVTELFGWRWVFVLLALAFAFAAWPLLRSAKVAAPAPAPAQAQAAAEAASAAAKDGAATPPAPQGLRELLRLPRQPRVRWVLTLVALERACMTGVLALIPAHLAQRHGLGTSAAGSVLALFGVGGLLYSRMARRLIRALGERGLALAGGALLGVTLPVLAWAGHWVAALPACLLAGAGFYMLHTTLQTQATQMAPAQRGSAVALFACLLFLGQSGGVAAVSVAVDRGFGAWAFTACAAGLVLIAWRVSRGVAARAG